jgi:hypothetical protein
VHLQSLSGERPSKATETQSTNLSLDTYSSYACLQALDNFIAPIPGFEGEMPILAVPILARTPSAESVITTSKGPSARSLKTQAGKRKVASTLPPPKKIRKVIRKKVTGVKINDHANSSKPHPG